MDEQKDISAFEQLEVRGYAAFSAQAISKFVASDLRRLRQMDPLYRVGKVTMSFDGKELHALVIFERF